MSEKPTNVFLDFAQIDFTCPLCGKVYSDENDLYLNRCNKNKSGYTRIKCECGEVFGMTYNMLSEAVGFKLEKHENKNLVVAPIPCESEAE